MSNSVVACPRCKRTQPVRTADSIYWCEHCRCQFDNDPDEGGSHSDFNPAARMEREERRKQEQAGNRSQRRSYGIR